MPDELRGKIERTLATISIDDGGGCSVHKAYVMAWLIRHYRLKPTLDIGVYRGRSFFPQAIAHRDHTHSAVYGVDPWSATEAAEDDNPALREAIQAFVATTDFDDIYRQVVHTADTLKLSANIRIVRKPSTQAAEQFQADQTTFGLIHIDGNHDAAPVMRDVELYLPLLQPGGFLVMDDVSWDSVRPAEDYVAARCRLVLRRITPDKLDDFAIYRKGGSGLETALLARRLRRLGEDTFLRRRVRGLLWRLGVR